ncbi:MAG: Tyrosine--tRNA ligase [Candidatus Anoxychlamydiales bacterium]|nr:Tyrosine--tRNA ligase [Candidatus Anoxychlamydiales bacterium]
MNKELDDLKKNFAIIIPEDGLDEKTKYSIEKRKPLNIKLGFDPTAPELHLGHAVVLKKLKEFQELGHQLIIIIGDFTALIGDPTGRNKTRPPLTKEEIKINAKTYLDQLCKIIDVKKAKVYFNSKWLDSLNLNDLIKLFSHLTLSQIIQREDFANRLEKHLPISFHELVYPIIQGYDSYKIDADIEVGGTDQMFNCLVGRDIQSAYKKEKQVVCCMPILRGTDGVKKMSKSLNNYIALTENPNDMFGKVMSIPDNLITEYIDLASSFSLNEKEKIMGDLKNDNVNPMEIKKKLAFNIVEQYHSKDEANMAQEFFYKQVQSRNETLIEYQNINFKKINLEFSSLTLIDLCKAIEVDKSKSQLRKLIEGGGVKINNEKIIDPLLKISTITNDTFKIKIGKRGFYQIEIN